MRTSMWAGLLQTMEYNKSRQQQRVKLFEIGACFHLNGDKVEQSTRLAGLIVGPAAPYQWGVTERVVDFYDLKGMIENRFNTCLSRR